MIDKIIYSYWQNDLPEVIDRNSSLDLKSDVIIDITGPRRAGKTYSMFSAVKKISGDKSKKSTIYINFENRRLLPLQENCFNDIISFIYSERLIEKYKKVFLFLDEVQRIDAWEKYVRGIYDEFKGKIKIIVSGSNANLLSQEYGKLLTGRHLTVNVFPLDFGEFLRFKNIKIQEPFGEKQESRIHKALMEYLRFGSFPEIVLERKSAQKENLINQLFADILARDILSREDTRKSYLVEDFYYFLASNMSGLLSFNKMARYFSSRGIKVSVPTLEHYFTLAKDAYLFFDHTVFSYKIKDQLQYSRKVYCIDTGIANLVGFKFSEDWGKFYENAVAVELRRRFFNQKAVRFFYWKNRKEQEVDFVVKRGVKIEQLIQVCYDISGKAESREKNSLLTASKELKCNNLLVVNRDVSKTETVEKRKIRFVPLWKWLLDSA